jgi:hypothetical protein
MSPRCPIGEEAGQEVLGEDGYGSLVCGVASSSVHLNCSRGDDLTFLA